MVVGLLGNESPDSNRFTPVTPKSENDVRVQATLGNQNPTGLPVGAVRVEEILDVPREIIISDYLRTNELIENDVNLIIEHVKKQTGITDERADESIRILFGALRDYIDSFYQAVNEKYGNISRYILDGLALSDEEIRIMKNKYLTA